MAWREEPSWMWDTPHLQSGMAHNMESRQPNRVYVATIYLPNMEKSTGWEQYHIYNYIPQQVRGIGFNASGNE